MHGNDRWLHKQHLHYNIVPICYHVGLFAAMSSTPATLTPNCHTRVGDLKCYEYQCRNLLTNESLPIGLFIQWAKWVCITQSDVTPYGLPCINFQPLLIPLHNQWSDWTIALVYFKSQLIFNQTAVKIIEFTGIFQRQIFW